ncbi:DUF2500 domain-containing protein [Bacillus sp. FJAT-49736]|uniref:DUF2500 domain-containing protein n=1 Tax=Bacillus sp. FJAT-49736 TaxID=2833582 RepID=UPI001BC8F3D6|nr:DUF2500 domain-containing protein [Bacillus sp. FJAT-49736]MBS4174366.1 DUF2500 domain-containing protein [Bacillus sp. FJAT-49736]
METLGEHFFNVFPYIFGFIFILVLGIFIIAIFGGISQWRKNNKSPRISVPAIVKTKRSSVSHHDDSSSTSYYVTFEYESGDRSEFHVRSSDYSQLAEGDTGILTFQGTRFLGFERKYEKQA